jgi:sugar phosphate isomerase/epimerase
MRFAAAGLLPADPLAAAPSIDLIRSLGLAGSSWHLRAPGELSRAELLELRSRLADGAIGLAQLLPPNYASLVDPEPAARRSGLEVLARCGEIAALVDADSLYVRPGSLNIAGPWTPHPHNHRPEVRARLVESLGEAARRAEGQGVVLAIEGHVVSPLDTPEMTRHVLDEVASPALRFNLDLVNYVGTIDDAYDPSALQARLLQELGEFVRAVHLKDVMVEERLVLHVGETIPGRGNVDFRSLLTEIRQVCPDCWLILEHLDPEDLPEAVAAVRRVAGAWS